jgi:TolB protein
MRRTTVILTLILLAGCSGADGVSRPPGASPAAEAKTGSPIPVTSLSGRIVFDNIHDIWSISARGTGLRRLTRSPWPEFDPAWSPDGRFIVFRAEPHGHPELWVMDADGSRKHRLIRDGGFPDWSPRCSLIAYAPGGGASGRSWIAVTNADGSEQRRLPRTDYGEYPSWSPDCERIAFNDNLSGEGLMSIVDADGSRVVDLSRVGQGHEVAWSPDGRSILFASQRDHPDGYNEIYLMHPDGSGVRRLTSSGAETPAWSPDGRYIVFGTAGGLGVMRSDGSDVALLPLDGVGEATFPDWR